MSAVRERLALVPPEILLAFEASWPRHNASKELAIRREFGVTPARYYQLLGRAACSLEGMHVTLSQRDAYAVAPALRYCPC